ncbi:RNA polymerase, sigma 28 (sigma F) factor [Gammaproteobacteria bacterium]
MSGVASYVMTREVDQDTVVTWYAPLVKRIAYHLLSRLPPSVQADDLIQAGMIGLLEASRNYDPTQKASFETYAGIRIRGSMLDEIRRSDWAPRSVHRKAREVADAIHWVESRTGRDARDQEVAEFLAIPLDEYHQILQDASGHRLLSLEDMVGNEDGALPELPDHSAGPLEQLEENNFRAALVEAINHLPERERLVMSLYYDDELNLREIGVILGVTESRVSQIHSQAMLRLRARLHDWTRRN